MWLTSITKRCTEAVFNALNIGVEVRYQEAQLLQIISSPKFSEWVVESLGKYSLFGVNRTTHIDTSYVQVSMNTSIDQEKYRSRKDITDQLLSRQATTATVNVSILEAVNYATQDIAVIGVAGSGKTTMLRYIALCAARGERFRGRRRFPFYISLRDQTTKPVSVRAAMERFLRALDIEMPHHVVQHMIRSGSALVLVDGIDEISESEQRELLRELDDFRAIRPHTLSMRARVRRGLKSVFSVSRKPREQQDDRASEERPIFVLSGRPYSLSRALSGFTRYQVMPLGDSAKLQFIEKWFSNVDEGRGRKLVELVAQSHELLELGSNPLLLSIICALYFNEMQIPSEPEQLFARCLRGLMGEWDYFRSIARETPLSGLDVHRRTVLLTILAANTLFDEHIVFKADDPSVVKSVNLITSKLENFKSQPDALLISLYNDFGILVERARGFFSFSHLQFQEYLAAKFLVDQRKELEILRIAGDSFEKWVEVIVFIGRLLNDAENFLTKLHESVRYDDPNQIWVLSRLWRVSPICSDDLKTQLFSRIAIALESHIGELGWKYSIGIGYLQFDPAPENVSGTNLHLSSRQKQLVLAVSQILRLLADNHATLHKLNAGETSVIRDICEYSRTVSRDRDVTNCCIHVSLGHTYWPT